MILIIKKGEGEYDDYHEFIGSVWSIRRSKIDFEKEYQQHLLIKYQKAGLPINFRNGGGMDFTLIKTKKQFKEIRKIAEAWNPNRFIKEVLKGKELKFQDCTL